MTIRVGPTFQKLRLGWAQFTEMIELERWEFLGNFETLWTDALTSEA